VYGQNEHLTTTVAYVAPGSVSANAGFQAGDTIKSVNGMKVDTWEDLPRGIIEKGPGGATRVVVKQGDFQRTLMVDQDEVLKAISNEEYLGLVPSKFHVVFDNVITFAPAGRAGFLQGDKPKLVDSTSVVSALQFRSYVRAHANRSIVLTVVRNDSTYRRPVVVGSDSTIGVAPRDEYYGDLRHQEFSIVESMSYGCTESMRTFGLIGTTITSVIKGKLAAGKAFGGPITIAQQASRSASLGAEPFLRFMALISVSLAFMNLLPIPGLDGGHLVIVLIESVIRRELAPSTKMRIQQVGVSLLLLLMATIIFLEIKKNIGF
jgi:regulator of sigma E protease